MCHNGCAILLRITFLSFWCPAVMQLRYAAWLERLVLLSLLMMPLFLLLLLVCCGVL